MDNRSNFLFGGFIAITSYLIIVLAFFINIQERKATKYKTQNTQTILEINIVSVAKEEQKTVQSKVEKPKPVKTIVKKTVSKSAKKTTDLKSLFAKVSTKSSKIVKQQTHKTKTSTTQSRFKSKYEREKKVDNVKLSKLSQFKDESKSNKSKKMTQSNDDGKFDQYYSKINNLILTKWYNYPLLTDSKYKVEVNITIDKQGKFSYHVVLLSGISNVDNSVKTFLENQRLELYPISPDGKTKTIRINFIPEQ